MRRKVVLLFLVLLFGCRSEIKKNVILISLDTVRRDCWGELVGSPRLDMPNIKRIFEERKGIVFRNAFSTAHYSVPSHMSAFTGMSSIVHSILEVKVGALPPSIPTIAEILKSKGYTTIAIHSNALLGREGGFHKGFDVFIPIRFKLVPSEAILEEVSNYLGAAVEEKVPFFAFIHFMDAHSDPQGRDGNTLPYYSPPSYRKDLPIKEGTFCRYNRCADSWLRLVREEAIPLKPEKVELVEEIYRRGVRFLDSQLAKLFDLFEKWNLFSNSIIIIFSDHGEEFKEHKYFGHSQPFIETIAIPMMLITPDNDAPKIVDTPVWLPDIVPTFLDYLGLQYPVAFDGLSLFSLLSKNQVKRKIVGTAHVYNRWSFFIIDFPYSVKYDPRTDRVKVFNLMKDPKELHDIAEIDKRNAAMLKNSVKEELIRLMIKRDRIYGAWPRARFYSFDRDVEEELKALGYL